MIWHNLWFETGELEQRQKQLSEALGIITLQSRSRVVDPMPFVVNASNDSTVTFFPTMQFNMAVAIEHS
jgi:hypothetical protein